MRNKSESDRREKFIKNLKSRQVDDSGFLNSRPLGCGLSVWVMIIIFLGIVLGMIFTAFSLERLNWWVNRLTNLDWF